MPNTYKDLLLLRGGERNYFALVPTSIADPGDYALVNGELLEISLTDWVAIDSPVYRMIQESSELVEPDAILRIRWQKGDKDDS